MSAHPCPMCPSVGLHECCGGEYTDVHGNRVRVTPGPVEPHDGMPWWRDIPGESAAERRERLPYGPVAVIRGQHAGRVGEYDDDDGGEVMCWVYLASDRPELVRVRSTSLVPCSDRVLAREWQRYGNATPTGHR